MGEVVFKKYMLHFCFSLCNLYILEITGLTYILLQHTSTGQLNYRNDITHVVVSPQVRVYTDYTSDTRDTARWFYGEIHS